MKKITRKKFKEATGLDPEHDDLDRCNCELAGKPGHLCCGWCPKCDMPRHACGHYVYKVTVQDIITVLESGRKMWENMDIEKKEKQ